MSSPPTAPHGTAGVQPTEKATGPAGDPILWLVVVAYAVAVGAYFVPGIDPELLARVENDYALIPLLGVNLIAICWGLRELPSGAERRFWSFIGVAMGLNLLVPFLYTLEFFSTDRGDLLVELVYLLFYLFLIFAALLRPDRERRVFDEPPERVEALATAAFLVGLMAYFVVIPEAVAPGSQETWVPSLVFYWTVDLFLAGFLIYLHRTSVDDRWRAVYAWLALAALAWAATDAFEAADNAGLIEDISDHSPVNAVWYIPYFIVGVAARFRTTGWPPLFARLGGGAEAAGATPGRMGVVVLYALILPLLHFGANLSGVMDEPSRTAREITVLVFLPVLMGLAFAHQRLLERRAQRLDEVRRALERQRALLTAAVEQSVDAVMVADRSGRIAYANPAWERVGGWSREELVGRLVLDALEGLGEEAVKLFQAAPRKGVAFTHVRRTTEDGSEVEEDLSVSPVRDAHGNLTHFTLFLRDVTNETRLERQLQQAQRMEALGTLAGGIAHDFNNMLAAILGYSELLLDETEDEEMREDIREILKAADRAKELTAQILTFSRLQEAERRPVFLGAVVAEALKLIRPTIPSSITVETDIDPGTGRILAEESRLHQVVLNLVTNAVHAVGEKGRISIRVAEMTHEWREDVPQPGVDLPDGAYAVLTLTDDGMGMAPETLARMYDPFFTTKELGHGTGLGLSVVHGIVASQGGAIEVESSVGAGTTFHVYLPLASPADGEGVQASQARHGDNGAHHLLVVDDEEMVANVLARGLERAGFRITKVTDPRDALETFLAAPGSFDGVITDQTMPGLTGLELASEIRRVKPFLPVVLLTGFSDSVTPERTREAGVAEVLYKPVSRADLVVAIRAHVAGGSGMGGSG